MGLRLGDAETTSGPPFRAGLDGSLVVGAWSPADRHRPVSRGGLTRGGPQGGKVDRVALKSLSLEPAAPRGHGSVPQTDMQKIIAGCWEDILQIAGLSLEDDFFELGGDSLQAINMTVLLQARLQMRLPLGALFFQDPTVGAFASAIELEITEEIPVAVISERPPDDGTHP